MDWLRQNELLRHAPLYLQIQSKRKSKSGTNFEALCHRRTWYFTQVAAFSQQVYLDTMGNEETEEPVLRNRSTRDSELRFLLLGQSRQYRIKARYLTPAKPFPIPSKQLLP